MCALNKDIANKFVIKTDTTHNTDYSFKNAAAGESYYFNVIAKVKVNSKQGGDHSEYIPYQPIRI